MLGGLFISESIIYFWTASIFKWVFFFGRCTQKTTRTIRVVDDVIAG